MEQVKFIRGTNAQINAIQLTEGAFYYATDTKELSMAMGGALVPLDNSIYWIFDGESMLSPSQVNKRIAYDVKKETLYMALNNRWYKVGRDAYIEAGVLTI